MHLIYLDESGNSGGNLTDPRQPLFVLCALIVPEQKWQTLESALATEIERSWPAPRPDDFEVHASELINPKSSFIRSATPAHRLAFMQAWLTVAARHELKVVARAIVKRRYAQWLHQTFGAGVFINPHVGALSLVTQVINSHLKSLPGQPLGIIISDENHQVARDVDKSIRLLRGHDGPLRLTQIIEKGFFIESHKSFVLQLCDLCAYAVRRHEEIRHGSAAKPVDTALWQLVSPLLIGGDEKTRDVVAWLESQQKKGAARGMSRGNGKGPNRSGRWPETCAPGGRLQVQFPSVPVGSCRSGCYEKTKATLASRS